jgi:hypothetical protein
VFRGRIVFERLAEVFSQVADPRKPRGVRHPFPAILSLVFLGLLARITEMAVVTRWDEAHWDELKGPLALGQPLRATAEMTRWSPLGVLLRLGFVRQG